MKTNTEGKGSLMGTVLMVLHGSFILIISYTVHMITSICNEWNIMNHASHFIVSLIITMTMRMVQSVIITATTIIIVSIHLISSHSMIFHHTITCPIHTISKLAHFNPTTTTPAGKKERRSSLAKKNNILLWAKSFEQWTKSLRWLGYIDVYRGLYYPVL